ncbi:MAG: protein-glutamate O-methyltransferase CheR [Lachnospiraceae bacterium]|nr:protein-glutamate O-methyltransferase CheR [Lachnospiraceae bacterium]MDE6625741.1 protein-glutamate O-methyltransferase CheR [Lachnospiraceae bacterium]
MKDRYGIELHQKKVIVNGRLENYIKRGGWSNFAAFMNAVENDKSGTQEAMLVNFLTTNHTYFMREFEHFEYFKKVVLPWLQKKESARKDLRIWCGAASSGEEPYMIAMVLADFFGLERKQWDTKVLATDISTKVLKQAMAGVYTAEQLKKLPDQWKRHFFKPLAGGTQYQVTDELKQEVLFRQFNLMDPFPFKKKMHTVFLRNVMIYFDEPTKKQVIQKVYDALEPGGYLFIGTTETLDRGSTPFQIIQPSIFRKREG